MNGEYIPQATAEKLATPIQKGGRHKAAMDIAFSLIGNGMPEVAVFATLRAKFEADVTDKELNDVVSWAKNQNPTPCSPTMGRFIGSSSQPRRSLATVKPKVSPAEKSDWWLGGYRMSVEDFGRTSPTAIPAPPAEYAALALSSLYREDDAMNVVCKFAMQGDKARPLGGGKTMSRDEWVRYFGEKGVPASDAGAWLRLNPCGAGSGKDGAPTDADVTRFAMMLLESDVLPIDVQLALLDRLKLPVAAVVLSGGASAHAWLRVLADTAEQFKELAKSLLALLEPFGFDPANCNPSRLCRLPGATRVIGSENGGEQRLIYLNPGAKALAQSGIADIAARLEFPFDDGKPLKALARAATSRYERMYENRGRLGIPTGIPDLDAVAGGWKDGHTIVIAGETGGGKTTVAMHCIAAALEAGHGVLMFSLEMDREEIFDLIMARRANVNRNHFNTGHFTDIEIAEMTSVVGELGNLPLYIEDSSLTGVEEVRRRALQLKADNRIALIVVDYIQFVNPGMTKDNREQQIAGISHELRSIARETHMPMIVLSQLNDEGKLRESRVIAHNANIVAKVEVDGNVVTVRLIKGRGIPCGEYTLDFNRSLGVLIPRHKPAVEDQDIPTRHNS